MPEKLLYEGKAKKLFTTEDPGLLRVEYKDDATAFNGKKFDRMEGKGQLNNAISIFFFEYLGKNQIPSHFVRRISETEQLVRSVQIVPLEVVVRNVAAGSLSKRIGWDEGRELPYPIVEFYYKDDDLGDPLLAEEHIRLLELATEEEMQELKKKGLAVNKVLRPLLEQKNIRLIDFKLEFGLDQNGGLLLADEISPDTCRFWDADTGNKMDKDRFRRDLGGVTEAYREIYQRLTGDNL
ncbi:MAG: phosphoribosylaminoimidazolesuccinocarboxamide synthase [SAR324 cluster bacterium]|nr:phosphoribosylaminoimidazolesuccinocarboxamide synthase [Deltaproteobacteria bacterium]MDP6248650.1 phosphoribosylaminoimidazolesuccinocarboxamide synthase [SAR324 cluster bacterium]MDP7136806.1 phosphoribosylaminoimidazolesuccinocarboxamide synthase [SAR324 cluster bacterium]MDP7332060.1 phosphoribosylaminoimidazolesuccinocarboxamide synthase [SAR324 cluster bacterium]HCP35896.1 phosphoribosylaminoimidazolesuccinocarboxamide synthase [Deltaproteobacteria bacterium]|tara:strand:- start:758 stop:1471 length:714 start_codon:yes stop_codon:yes gene_type:complete